MSETKVVSDIRIAFEMERELRLFRNNVGALKNAEGRLVTFGLGTGTHDIIGLKHEIITQEMVGQSVARFISIEVKDPLGHRETTAEQKSFRKMVRKFGGYSGVARTISDAQKIIAGLATGETDELRDR